MRGWCVGVGVGVGLCAAHTVWVGWAVLCWRCAQDMGWGEPELYPSTSDHGRISTPNLNKFGQGGIQFTNAYAGYVLRRREP